MSLCFTTAIFLGSLSSLSFADCPNGNTGYIAHSTLSGQTVCVGSAGNWQNQEYHAPGGDLIDWKKGASDPVDPTKSIGSWAVSGSGSNEEVTYTYNTGESYSYRVHDNGSGNYSFCDGTNEIVQATIKAGQSACP
jgi:prepilin-type processing-associated H-X9-DG protein